MFWLYKQFLHFIEYLLPNRMSHLQHKFKKLRNILHISKLPREDIVCLEDTFTLGEGVLFIKIEPSDEAMKDYLRIML